MACERIRAYETDKSLLQSRYYNRGDASLFALCSARIDEPINNAVQARFRVSRDIN
jgi:hypothetical protein